MFFYILRVYLWYHKGHLWVKPPGGRVIYYHCTIGGKLGSIFFADGRTCGKEGYIYTRKATGLV